MSALRSLSARLIALIGVAILLILAPTATFWHRLEREAQDRHLTQMAELLALSTAANLEYPLSIGDDEDVRAIVGRAVQTEDVLYVIVENETGVLIESIAAGSGCEVVSGEARCAQAVREARQPVGDASQEPLAWLDGPAAAPSRPPVVRVGLGSTTSDANLMGLLVRALLFTVLAALLVFVIAMIFARRLTAPIRDLHQATLRMACGDLSVRVQPGGTEELAGLSRSFNKMADGLEGARRSLEAALRRQNATLAAMTDFLLVVGPDRNILFANRVVAEATGLSVGTLIGQPIEEVLAGPGAEPIALRSSREIDAIVHGTGGMDIPVQLTCSSIMLESEAAVLCVARDMRQARLALELSRANRHLSNLLDERLSTEAALREARNEALEASRLKSEFLANMSHEIRTPMNGVIGMTSLLLGAELPGETQEWVETIRDSSETLLALINDILDFSKIEAGKLELEQVDFDVAELLSGATDLVAAKGQEKGLELAISIDPSVPRTLRGDPARLRQIIVNLVSNAVKFTSRGEVVVGAEVIGRREQTVELIFSVRDTGPGIAPAACSAIFDAFRQLDGSTTRKFGGTGLGLAISRQLTRLMGGEIQLESKVGEGSTFSVRLELEAGTAPEVPKPAVKKPILCASAFAVTRASLARELRGLGFDVIEAEDRASVLRALPGCGAALIDHRLGAVDTGAVPSIGLALHTHAAAPRAQGGRRLLLPLRRARLVNSLTELGLLDAGPAGERQRRVEPAPKAALDAAFGKLRVLVADDNGVNQKVAERLLQRLGIHPTVVASGQEALDACAEEPFDCVFMDCQMPELDGYDATRALRAREPNGKHTRVIAMTANAMKGDREKCLAAGMDDYVAKPVRLEDLEAALTRWLLPRSSLPVRSLPPPERTA